MEIPRRIFSLFTGVFVLCLVFSTLPAAAAETQLPAVPSPDTFDLGVKNVGLLPISPLYFLKEWRRDIVRAMTTNPLGEVSFELQVLNEKAAEAQKVAEFRSGDNDSLEKALENYEVSLTRVGQGLTYLNASAAKTMNKEFLSDLLAESDLHYHFFEALGAQYATSDEVVSMIDALRTKLAALATETFDTVGPDLATAILKGGEDASSTGPATDDFITTVEGSLEGAAAGSSTEALSVPSEASPLPQTAQ